MELQTLDRERFELLKKSISDGIAVCYIVGAALREIKEREFWKADGYESFESFCDAEWGWTKRYCNQLIVDSDAINSLPPSMRKLITSHAAAAELAKLPETLRLGVVAQVVNTKKPVTATAIKKATPTTIPSRKPSKPPARKKDPDKPNPIIDGTGIEVPVECLDLWERGIEAQELITFVSAIRLRLNSIFEAKDKLFVELDFTDGLASLSRLLSDVQRAKPYAVCPSCQGKLAKGCIVCKERGFVSKYYWDTFVPEEQKALRKTAKP
jgi:hypothetical protein